MYSYMNVCVYVTVCVYVFIYKCIFQKLCMYITWMVIISFFKDFDSFYYVLNFIGYRGLYFIYRYVWYRFVSATVVWIDLATFI